MKLKYFLLNFFIFFSFSLMMSGIVSGAHFIIGAVPNAKDGTSADGKIALLWSPSRGISDNITDIIGPNGNGGVSGFYMIDCELLTTPCSIGENMTVRVINTQGGTESLNDVNVSVTDSGFDVAGDLLINSLPQILNVSVDDALLSPSGEIDLVAASTQKVNCSGIIYEHDNQSQIQSARGEFFSSSSFFGDSDDNNYHYTNSSCFMNASYGTSNESLVYCDFTVQYYAAAGAWNCTLQAQDTLTAVGNTSRNVTINSLISLQLPSSIDFGTVIPTYVSNETVINVTNVGNVIVNLSLSGYGSAAGDGLAMNCTDSKNFSIVYEKYNLTTSHSGSLSLSEFEQRYTNLTSSEVIRTFNLRSRSNDVNNDAINATYWRIYTPAGIHPSNCAGNIVFGARQASGI